MRLRFDPGLPHQRAAIDAVVDLLDGVPAGDPPVPAIASVVPNTLPVSAGALHRNLQAVQQRAGLAIDDALAVHDGAVQISVDMETGTGKTYTYLRTLLTLASRHALRKWLIIVPSVAIREGVLATLRHTRAHFRSLYPQTVYRFWAYEGDPTRARSFATAAQVEIAVLTIAAFNKSLNRLRRPDDRLGGRAPLEWIAAARPCLVLDEPHHYDSRLSKTSLADLGPLLTLRYGATHRHTPGLVHRLSPRQAAAQGLVKRVEIAPVPASEDEATRISAQIHEAIRLHVQRQRALTARGIKVLSLFFVPSVDSYTAPDGLCRVLFDRHFEALKHGCPALGRYDAAQVRAAYFATKGRAKRPVQTSGESAADVAAYQLILRDKLKLLSLQEPVAFIFSHSALREGWDNPNIFVVCTLAPRTSGIRRRQEIGRGCRLCVDQSGARVGDRAVDVLSVVPAEPYEAFVAAWETEHDGPGPEDSDRRAPKPGRLGAIAAPPGPAATVSVVWRPLDAMQLVSEARQHVAANVPQHGAAPPSRSPALAASVVALLARRRPPIALTPATIDAVIDRCISVTASATVIAEAIAAAVAAQGW